MRPAAAGDPSARSWTRTFLEEFEHIHGPLSDAERAAVLATGPDEAPASTTDGRARLNRLAAASGQSALCLSGGGIRSASFALGVLQGLARLGILTRFDYLSTVSGGGFAGGWLSAWLLRCQTDESAKRAFAQFTGDEEAAATVEPAPLARLRAYTRYLTPRGGITSADSWTLAATLIRNLLLNWLVLVPSLAAALLVPRLHYALIRVTERRLAAGSGPADWDTATGYVLLCSAALLFFGVAYAVRDLPSYGNRRQSQGAFLTYCLTPLALGALGLTYFWSMDTVPLSFVTILVLGATGNLLLWFTVGLFTPRKFRPRTWLAAAGAGTVPSAFLYVATRVVFPDGEPFLHLYAATAFPLVLLIHLSNILVFIGIAGEELDAADLEWWARCAAWVLIVAVGWLAFSVIVFGAPRLLDTLARFVRTAGLPVGETGSRGVIGLLASALGALSAWLTRPAAQAGQGSALKRAVLSSAAPAFVVLLLATLAWADERAVVMVSEWPTVRSSELSPVCTDAQLVADTEGLVCHPRDGGVVDVALLGAALLLFGGVMTWFVPANRFSLNGMYYQRLTRAFLGVSRSRRTPNPFTGFDPGDDLPMSALAPVRPLHVVNTTLNRLVGTTLDHQDRKCDPFTISPLHAGSPVVGYRPSSRFGANRITRTGVSLGGAVTVSGAAASSAMGMNSKPALTFLFTFFNARLGAWVGNPAHRDTWTRDEPPAGATLVFSELLGLDSEQSPYIYLSDGGHHDNLGLVEMVRRRCRFIVVSDAGADPAYAFDDLANAIRLIRIDFGIGIDIDLRGITRAGRGNGNAHAAIGTIHYDDVDPGAAPGVLILIKATLSGDEPADVLNYAGAHAEFPHESTTDQWFTEAQFESYRALGRHSVEAVAGSAFDASRPADVAGFVAALIRTAAPPSGRPATPATQG